MSSFADSFENNLFSVKNVTSSMDSDKWYTHSKSKELVQAEIDLMKGLHVSFKWKDQGCGNQKGRVALKVMNGTDEVFRIEDWGVAPHEKESVSVMYDEDHYFVKNLVEGCYLELWYFVGEGEYRLEVDDFRVDILSTEDVQKAKEFKNEQFIKGSAQADSFENNLFSEKYMADYENSDSWSFRSKSKDLMQAEIDRMKGLHVSFKWEDQGFGNQKGRVAVKLMNGTDEVYRIEDWGVAPHKKETVSVMFDEDHYFVKNLVEGCCFKLWYVVGGGGGHSLWVQDFRVDILSADDVQKAKELKNEQFIIGSTEEMENRYSQFVGHEIPEVEHRGISLRQLETLYEEVVLRCVKEAWTNFKREKLTPEKVNLYDIKEKIIMPRTEKIIRKCSYVELIANKAQIPKWFVSHWWGEPIIAMIMCLRQHAKDRGLSPEESFYWICAYANNQHRINEEMKTNPFLRAMEIVEGTVSILDSNCVVYSRIWCVYELYKSIMSQKENYKFDIYTDYNLNSAVGITHGVRRFPIDRIMKVIDIDVANAEASVQDDAKFIKNTITNNIDKNGEPPANHPKYDELNMILKSKFVTPVIHRIIHVVNDDTKVQLCLEIFKNSSPREIYLDFENCSRFNDDIARRLVGSLPPTIEELWVYSNGSAVTQDMIDSLPGMILSKLPNLLFFHFLDSNMSDIGAEQIATIIRNHSSLKQLCFPKSKIGDEGAIQLLDAIEVKKTIEYLDLIKCNISMEGRQRIREIEREIVTHRKFKLMM